jgi:hypothetical protein
MRDLKSKRSAGICYWPGMCWRNMSCCSAWLPTSHKVQTCYCFVSARLAARVANRGCHFALLLVYNALCLQLMVFPTWCLQRSFLHVAWYHSTQLHQLQKNLLCAGVWCCASCVVAALAAACVVCMHALLAPVLVPLCCCGQGRIVLQVWLFC